MPVMAIQAKEGKVTPLAVTGTKRSSALPDVPTIQELGLDYVINGWYGIIAPPGTPPRSSGSCATRPRRQSRQPTSSRHSPSRAWSRAARNPTNTAIHGRGARVLYQDRQGREPQTLITDRVASDRWPGCLPAIACLKGRIECLAAPGSTISPTTSSGPTPRSSSRVWRPMAWSRSRRSTALRKAPRP